MKTKLKGFIRHLSHEIEDEEKAEEYLDNMLPSIGLIVMYFNSLESSLESVLCKNFTDRTDSTGLIVLNSMNYAAKVELFKRFSDSFQTCLSKPLNGYESLIGNLKESGRLRKVVVHANWESTDEEDFTYVRLKMSKKGMQQEYVQFTEDSLQQIIELIIKTRYGLYEFWHYRNDVLYGRT